MTILLAGLAAASAMCASASLAEQQGKAQGDDVEGLTAANRELKAANRELRATNRRLKGLNEELSIALEQAREDRRRALRDEQRALAREAEARQAELRAIAAFDEKLLAIEELTRMLDRGSKQVKTREFRIIEGRDVSLRN